MRLTKLEQARASWYRLVVSFVPLHICNVHRLAYLVKGSLFFATEYAVLMRRHTASCISSAFLVMLADTDGIRFDWISERRFNARKCPILVSCSCKVEILKFVDPFSENLHLFLCKMQIEQNIASFSYFSQLNSFNHLLCQLFVELTAPCFAILIARSEESQLRFLFFVRGELVYKIRLEVGVPIRLVSDGNSIRSLLLLSDSINSWPPVCVGLSSRVSESISDISGCPSRSSVTVSVGVANPTFWLIFCIIFRLSKPVIVCQCRVASPTFWPYFCRFRLPKPDFVFDWVAKPVIWLFEHR